MGISGPLWAFSSVTFFFFIFHFSFFSQFVHHRCVFVVDITHDTATNMELFFFFFFCDCLL